ncbi:unnamed protein product [Owenia fusiformis]|uniref:Uncharacterized protein n=1 Tax=Owenia fusiformis TaxID=6347 RepID=A0A8J1T829_OWEFU|nr:unnamed protein product [Owenia fusiformis]
MPKNMSSRITYVALFFSLYIHNFPAWKDTEECHHDNFFLVRQGWRPGSNCTKMQYIRRNSNLTDCFKSACKNNSNLVIHKQYKLKQACTLYRCESNHDITDWEYGWSNKWESTKAYALLHPSTPRCRNSFFIRRTWDTGKRVCANCDNIKYMNVEDLYSCMSHACDEEANALNFWDKRKCQIMRCRWNSTRLSYNFNFSRTAAKVTTYSLASQITTVNTMTTILSPKPTTQTKPQFFRVLALIMTGVAGMVLGLITVAVFYYILIHRRRQEQIPGQTSRDSLDYYSYTYTTIDESTMMPCGPPSLK